MNTELALIIILSLAGFMFVYSELSNRDKTLSDHDNTIRLLILKQGELEQKIEKIDWERRVK